MEYKMGASRILIQTIIVFLLLTGIAFSLLPIKKIDSCTSINMSGQYLLSNNILGTSSQNSCLIITSDNVDLDCSNNLIKNSQKNNFGSGILINGVKNISIKNCNVMDYAYLNSAGIAIYNSQRVSIDKGFTKNNYFGITSINSNQIIIIDHKSENNLRTNLDLTNIADSTLRGSSSVGAEIGLSVLASNSLVVGDNSFTGSKDGISISNSKNIQLEDNLVFSNKNGISISNSNSSLTHNNISTNAGYGLSLSFANPSELKNNLIYKNNLGVEILNSKVSFNQDKLKNTAKDLSVLGTFSSPSIINGILSPMAPPIVNYQIGIKDWASEVYSIKFVTDPLHPQGYEKFSDFFVKFDSQNTFNLDLFEFLSVPADLSIRLMKYEKYTWSEVSTIKSDKIGTAVTSPLIYGLFRHTEPENFTIPLVQFSASCNTTDLTLTDQKGLGLSGREVILYDGSQYRSEVTNRNGFASFNACGYLTILSDNSPSLTYAPNCVCTDMQNSTTSSCSFPSDPSCPPNLDNVYVISGPILLKTGSALTVRVINDTTTCNKCFMRITDPNGIVHLSITDDAGAYSSLADIAGYYKIELLSENESINPNTKILQTYSVEAQEDRNFMPLIFLVFGIGILLMILILTLRGFSKKK